MLPPPDNPLEMKLEMLHDDIGEMKVALSRLSDAIVKLALIEERQAVASAAMDRAFSALERVEQRVTTLEKAAVTSTRTSNWVDRAATAGIGVLLLYVLKAVGLL
jgi:CRISPR/Cas system-associated protein Csm6